ncbi:hypothetical protein FA15DRAFT_354914 [Coprinopsis marcescibilis]|uniref:Uncharacterized protein n=1 Tax=Coprinopsis marcescibilis TaxID=230819 RepID=A0A5C3KY39_COPMA|nr:hypothetical protein FA15DRAFT_354914 [Coprinopsis marcescibilis]
MRYLLVGHPNDDCSTSDLWMEIEAHLLCLMALSLGKVTAQRRYFLMPRRGATSKSPGARSGLSRVNLYILIVILCSVVPREATFGCLLSLITYHHCSQHGFRQYI